MTGIDGLQATVGVKRRVGLDLGPVQGDHSDPDEARRRAQPEDLDEAGREGLLVAWRNRAMVLWSGTALAVITRKAMSSWHRRSILRLDRSPMQ